MGSVWDALWGLGAGRARPRRRRAGPDTPGAGRHAGHGYRSELAVLLAVLIEAYSTVGQAEEGLTVLADALHIVETTGEHFWEAELHRLKGALLLKQSTQMRSKQHAVFTTPSLWLSPAGQVPGTPCRLSLSRLWQHQGKRAERLASCWHRSMAGSLRALTRPTCKRPRHCWRSWQTDRCKRPAQRCR